MTNKEITINIPFTYTLGEEGFFSNKILETEQDCIDEMLAEINIKGIDTNNVYFKVEN